MSLLRTLFDKIAHNAIRADNGKQALRQLDTGIATIFAPRSDRYTRENQEDTDYNKNWTPKTKVEKETLSPENYYRIGERQQEAEKAGANGPNADYVPPEKQVSIPSTALKKIRYSPKSEGLYVTFTGSNKEYFYPAVPLELIEELIKAPSKGEFFMANIHDQYSMYGKDHRRKNRKEQKAVKKYAKAYEKANKNKWA